jgi:hypothetical protein
MVSVGYNPGAESTYIVEIHKYLYPKGIPIKNYKQSAICS